MIARPCARCGEPIAAGSYCVGCTPTSDRTNTTHVAYRNDARWKNLSRRLRHAAPFCEFCGSRRDLCVDHIVPVAVVPELTYAEENLRVLCRSCNGRRGNQWSVEEAHQVLARLDDTMRRRPSRRSRQRAGALRSMLRTRGVGADQPPVRSGGRRGADYTPRPGGRR